eukprot:TRINITY_DN3158_c0_g1_i1.p1 TRINITY_DN3158_c0_g1~~TRINITY_DN3158_c0_g1_i1.p1  ORF type:complete len:55 (+),score=5.25 TRINITY_DN3158_c0_g1_i1:66-230(+)
MFNFVFLNFLGVERMNRISAVKASVFMFQLQDRISAAHFFRLKFPEISFLCLFL